MGTEGLALIFLIFALEFSKWTLQDDKIRKKIEFFLANGVGIKFLVIKYFGAIYLASLLTLLPSLIFLPSRQKLES